jgi:hypothetical protein
MASNGSAIALGTNSVPGGGTFRSLNPDGSVLSQAYLGDYEAIVVPVANGDEWVAFYDVRSNCTSESCAKTEIGVAGLGSTRTQKTFVETPQYPSISAANDGHGHFLVAWSTVEPLDSAFRTYRIRVSYAVVLADGTLVSQPFQLENVVVTTADNLSIIVGNNVEAESPAVAFDGQQFLVGWTWFEGKGKSELRVMRIRPDGTRVDAQPVVVEQATDSQRVPRKSAQVALTNERVLFFWSSPRPSPSLPRVDVVERAVRSFDELATAAAPQPVSTSVQMQSEVSLASGDGAVLAAWHENDYGGAIMGRLIPALGAAPPAFMISTGTHEVGRPSVGFGGGIYLVAWRDEEWAPGSVKSTMLRILARRYDRNGEPLDAAPIQLTQETYPQFGYFPHPSIGIASDGTQFLVTWPGLEDDRIHAVRVSNSGAVLDRSPLAISPVDVAQRGAPRPVWTGQDFAVIWYEDPSPVVFTPPVRIVPRFARMTRVSSNGTLLDSTYPKIIETPQKGISVRSSAFNAAFNGTHILVTWSTFEFSNPGPGTPACAFAQRFLPDGTAFDPAPKTIACESQPGYDDENGNPDAFWDGSRWWIVYSNLAVRGSVYAVPLDAALMPQPAVRVSSDPLARTARAVALGGVPYIAYMRVDAASGSVRRVFYRTIGETRVRSARH